MGLRYAPARLSILLAARTPSWCVLHELAHAMTSHADGRSDGHGPVFMGVYVRLIERYLRIDPQVLIDSLRDAGIEIAHDRPPKFWTVSGGGRSVLNPSVFSDTFCP